jgi:hypothetical protein
MVKETMKRKKPSFNETYYGFRSFSHLLEDAQRRGIVTLRRDQKSGSYIIEDLGAAAAAKTDGAGAEPVTERKPEAEADGANGTRGGRRRRGRGGRTRRPGAPAPAGAPAEGAPGSDEAEDESDEDVEEGLSADSPEAPAAAEEPRAAAAPDKPAFSLFSWLRREGPDRKADQD